MTFHWSIWFQPSTIGSSLLVKKKWEKKTAVKNTHSFYTSKCSKPTIVWSLYLHCCLPMIVQTATPCIARIIGIWHDPPHHYYHQIFLCMLSVFLPTCCMSPCQLTTIVPYASMVNPIHFQALFLLFMMMNDIS